MSNETSKTGRPPFDDLDELLFRGIPPANDSYEVGDCLETGDVSGVGISTIRNRIHEPCALTRINRLKDGYYAEITVRGARETEGKSEDKKVTFDVLHANQRIWEGHTDIWVYFDGIEFTKSAWERVLKVEELEIKSREWRKLIANSFKFVGPIPDCNTEPTN